LHNHKGQVSSAADRALGAAYQDSDYVFCLEDGTHYHPERFSREFLRKQHQYNEANPDTSLPRLTIHGLRHTWATIAVNNNVPPQSRQRPPQPLNNAHHRRVFSNVTQPIAQDAADLVGRLILGSQPAGMNLGRRHTNAHATMAR